MMPLCQSGSRWRTQMHAATQPIAAITVALRGGAGLECGISGPADLVHCEEGMAKGAQQDVSDMMADSSGGRFFSEWQAAWEG